MEKVMEKIEGVLKGKEDSFFLVIDHETEKLSEFYVDNEEKIKKYIEKVITERELTFMQLYDLVLIYFKNEHCSKDAIEHFEAFKSSVVANVKNLKLLKVLLENTDSAAYLENMLPQLSEALSD